MTRRLLAFGYIRVSTTDQVENGASLDAQRAALTAEAERRGWDLKVVPDEGLSGKNLRRPGLQAALSHLDKGQADFLMATRLDRVSRSVADFAGILDRSARRGWGIVLLDSGIDTSNAAGRFTGNVLASAAQYERELISVRTREGMAQRKAEGVIFGRTVDQSFLSTYRRVLDLHAAGTSLNGIARTLNDEGTPSAKGGKWFASTVKAIVESETAKAL
ncbi:recombinase family protein [Rathayibacter sp. VKM Ac-2927]|uniref:recombinase family protein n=1 Tax=Rathayibacter sp. VKM Ac-2927 TaxID=2929478 RepID=UPI001FB2BE80|nr:recombinase family protein [Rathayibacter sp. VKM Ac-2927]MCJ1687865.1 recombinase family protein [Rathayibacter sp. VKM Ac-2927]